MISLRDYAPNEVLDRYSDADIDDDEDVEAISAAARRAAEAKMARRDRADRGGRRGQRAARRSRPSFLGSDDIEDDDLGDDELGIASMKKRTRKQYDERRDLDDLDGIEDASRPLVFSTIFILTRPLFRKFLLNN